MDSGGILINTVVAFSNNVKTASEIANEAVMINGLLFEPVAEPPMIIGSNGRTQGAMIVNIPAIKDPNTSNMCFLTAI